MSETHHIAGNARGEPLSGTPSPRWSRALGAHLANELTGHPAVGHLQLDEVVQGSELVLEGVEEREAPALGDCLLRAVEAANACVPDGEEAAPPANMPRTEADRIAVLVST
jgi:hypothetical protein